MLLLTVFCQFESHWFMHIFTKEEAVVAVGVQMLDDQLVELRRERHDLQLLVDVPGARQHLADDRLERDPAVRVHRAGAVAVARSRGSSCVQVWYVSVASMFLQAVVSFTLLRREFRRKLAIASTPRKGTFLVS